MKPHPNLTGAPSAARLSPVQRTWAVVLLLCACISPASAEIIQPANRVDWTPGVTVGLQVARPLRTNLIDVTQSPYNSDNTGVADSAAGIRAAIAAARSNDVVYFPNGLYRCDTGVQCDKSDVTLRGQSTGAVLMCTSKANSSYLLKLGHDAWGTTQFAVSSGATKGSTTLTLVDPLDASYKDQLFLLSAANTEDPAFPVISVQGFDRALTQPVCVSAISGRTVTLTAPLVWTFTNAPMLLDQGKPIQRVGLENLSFTLANTATGESGVATYVVNAWSLRNSWITNCNIAWGANYNLFVDGCVHCEISGCDINHAISTGTSRAGLLLLSNAGYLIENNVFRDGLFPAIEIFGHTVACAFFGNFVVNSSQGLDVLIHNTHPMMNLWEQNRLTGYFEMDGYFGSASHQTLLRNSVESTWVPLLFKRWTTFMQVVGNVLGNSQTTYGAYTTTVNGANFAHILQLGYPNIGNVSYSGTCPPQAWNWPGSDFNGRPNGTVVFATTQVNTTNLAGNFSDVRANEYLRFQDAADTNRYWPRNQNAPMSFAAGTTTNLLLKSAVTVSNGWRAYLVGSGAFQQLQTTDGQSHTIHGNYDFYHKAVTWDPNVTDHTVPVSLLYPGGPPAWWGTNRWPAIDTDATPQVAITPSALRYLKLDAPRQVNNVRVVP